MNSQIFYRFFGGVLFILSTFKNYWYTHILITTNTVKIYIFQKYFTLPIGQENEHVFLGKFKYAKKSKYLGFVKSIALPRTHTDLCLEPKKQKKYTHA